MVLWWEDLMDVGGSFSADLTHRSCQGLDTEGQLMRYLTRDREVVMVSGLSASLEAPDLR